MRVKSVIKWKPILIVAVLIAVGVIWALMRIPSDPADLVLIRTLDAGGPVFTVGFSGDSRIVLAGSADNSVRVWNVSTGTPDIPVKRDDDPVHAVAFSPVSQILAFGQTTKVHLYLLEGSSWDYKNSLRNEGHSASVTSIAFSPDGKSIVTGGEDSKVLVWDVRSPESPAKTLTLTQHRGPVRSVAYSPDGRTVLSGGDDARLFLWDAQAGGVKWNSNQSGTIRAVAFSPRADLVASGGRDIELLDAVSGEVEGTLNDTDVMTVAFSPIGTILASGGKDGKVRLWDVRTKELKTTISAHDGGVLTVAFSPDRTVLATAGQDQKLKIWQRK